MKGKGVQPGDKVVFKHGHLAGMRGVIIDYTIYSNVYSVDIGSLTNFSANRHSFNIINCVFNKDGEI